MMNRILPLLMILAACTLASCDKNRVYEENKDVPDGSWKSADKIPFEFEIKDTDLTYNVFINVRNASQYGYSNLYLYVHTTYPDGKSSLDTVNCILQDQEGKWLGDGLGDLWDNKIIFKPGVKFHQAGKYKIEYEEAMRPDPLQMIMDVGLRVEKAEN